MPKHYYFRCADRMCGAEDCPACHPENFKRNRYVDELELETLDSEDFDDAPITPSDPND